jgi:hypothetical protein
VNIISGLHNMIFEVKILKQWEAMKDFGKTSQATFYLNVSFLILRNIVKVSFSDVPVEQLGSRLPVAVSAPHPPVQPDPEAHSLT